MFNYLKDEDYLVTMSKNAMGLKLPEYVAKKQPITIPKHGKLLRLFQEHNNSLLSRDLKAFHVMSNGNTVPLLITWNNK